MICGSEEVFVSLLRMTSPTRKHSDLVKINELVCIVIAVNRAFFLCTV